MPLLAARAISIGLSRAGLEPPQRSPTSSGLEKKNGDKTRDTKNQRTCCFAWPVTLDYFGSLVPQRALSGARNDPLFGAKKAPAFGAKKAPAFGAKKAPAFGTKTGHLGGLK